jgi:RNA polymerase sigma-70 factor (ECF subfamily)
LQSFNTSERFSPWIYRIAHNTFLNEIRRQSKFSLLPFELESDVLFPSLIAPDTSDGEALTLEATEEVTTALALLKPKEREIIHLAHFEEMSYEAIADILRVPIGTVGVRLYRAKKKLRSFLTKSV